MIEKKIHYIWLGKNKKPDSFEVVHQSWQKFAVDFEVKEWGEENLSEFDLPEYFYFLMKNKKWAFASDILRFYILKKYGGIYLDVDQVLVKDIEILFKSFLIGKEFFISKYHQVDDYYGFGFIGQVSDFVFSDKMIEFYKSIKKEDFDSFVIVNKIGSETIKEMLQNESLNNKMQIFSQDFFYPLAGYCEETKNTFSFHLSNVSWQPKWKKLLYKFKFYFLLKGILLKIFPKKLLKKIGFNIDYL